MATRSRRRPSRPSKPLSQRRGEAARRSVATADAPTSAGYWQRGGAFFALGIVSTAVVYLIVTGVNEPAVQSASTPEPATERTTARDSSAPKPEAMSPAELERYRQWAEWVNARNRTFGSVPTSPVSGAPGIPGGTGRPGTAPGLGPTVPRPGLGTGGVGP